MNSDVGNKKELSLSKVLSPKHIWALVVGIVLVGDFMGWNFGIAKGGTLGVLIACWVMGIMYLSLGLINTEMATVIPEAGGQYSMAKYFMGPLASFNIGLMLVFQYIMLEAADALVVGQMLKIISPDINPIPFIILSLLFLTFINYRGVHGTLTLNFFITAISIITLVILFVSVFFFHGNGSLLNLKHISTGLPFGFIGIIGALQFGLWFYLGLEGGALAANECRSSSRSLPVGTVVGFMTLLIAGTVTWFLTTGLMNTSDLATSTYPLFDAAKLTGMSFVINALFIGTLFSCLASANGCINDASRAWYSMSKDTLIPDVFSALHPKYKTPYRAIIFMLPIALVFGFAGVLDQIVTFSIISAILVYIFTAYMIIKFRKMYPLGRLKRSYISPLHPFPAIIVLGLCILALFGIYFGYWKNLLGGILFYFIASIWFVKRRYKFVDKKIFIQKSWKRPDGY